jgi:hypothetical protein
MRHSLLSSQTKLGQLSRGKKIQVAAKWMVMDKAGMMDGWMDACMHAWGCVVLSCLAMYPESNMGFGLWN